LDNTGNRGPSPEEGDSAFAVETAAIDVIKNPDTAVIQKEERNSFM
jgi:hypothetical protein